jgi:hypothetical protein
LKVFLNMRRFSTLVTILITSFVMALAGLVASPIASASENDGGISATFASGSSVLSDAQKAAIKKALASSGSDVSFIVTGTAGKLPGVSDRWVQRLAKKRAQAIKAYLVSLGVSKTSITTQVKMTEIGETPKSIGSYPTPAPTPTPTVTAVAAASAPAAPAPTTCATGGTCVVGDRGPGGGIVFYVSAANFTSFGSTCGTACKYLEVAPATWQSAGVSVANDPLKVWSSNQVDLTTQVLSATSPTESGRTGEQENWKMGKGLSNTSLMKETSAAQAAVLAYAGNATAGQWFIPSMNELNELCKYARGQTTGVLTVQCANTGTLKSGITNDLGGFVASIYWSSSENVADKASYQRFDNTTIDVRDKVNGGYVRPVRAF